MPATPTAAILDLDGTLVDSNYLHALAWSRTFHAAGIDVPLWVLHRHVGMGGDQFVPAIAGERVEREQGDALREAWREQFLPLLDEVRPLPGAHDLLQTLHERGLTVALASSAPQEDLDHYLDLLDAHDLVETATTSADVEQTKPAPDLVGVVLDRLDGA